MSMEYIPLDSRSSLLDSDGSIGMSLLSLLPTVIAVKIIDFVVGPSGALVRRRVRRGHAMPDYWCT